MFLHGSFNEPFPNRKSLAIILNKGGCKVLKREPDPESIPPNEKTSPYHSVPGGPLSKCSHYIVYQEGQESGKQLIKYNMEHIKAVPIDWLFACFDNFALIDLEDFSRKLSGEDTPVKNCEDSDLKQKSLKNIQRSTKGRK